MIFRQLFDQVSGTYSYLLASRPGGEALIVDPVLEKVDRYLQLVKELDLKLVKALDTETEQEVQIAILGALGRVGTPEDCVGSYLFLASELLSGYVIGQIIEVNGGQLMP